MKDKNVTPVVFRQWLGDVIALLPTVPAAFHLEECLSYQAIGQHGAANYGYIIRDSSPAVPAKIAPLFRELENVGYILKEYPHDAILAEIWAAARRAEMERLGY